MLTFIEDFEATFTGGYAVFVICSIFHTWIYVMLYFEKYTVDLLKKGDNHE